MTYTYKCPECGNIQDIQISTFDIMDQLGRIDQKQLTERMNELKYCECGGQLKKTFSEPEVLWFNSGVGWGKISSRFK